MSKVDSRGTFLSVKSFFGGRGGACISIRRGRSDFGDKSVFF